MNDCGLNKEDQEKIVTVRSDEKTGRDIGLLVFVTDEEWRLLDELKQSTGLSIDEIYARGLELYALKFIEVR